MPLRVRVGDQAARSDDLTVEQLLGVEKATGKRWPEINPFASARDAFALVTALFGADAMTTARALPADVGQWVDIVDDDLPEAFRDCIPTMGGRSFDDYIVAFADPEVFGWPPDVTRRQRVRDLDLLLAAFAGRKGHR